MSSSSSSSSSLSTEVTSPPLAPLKEWLDLHSRYPAIPRCVVQLMPIYGFTLENLRQDPLSWEPSRSNHMNFEPIDIRIAVEVASKSESLLFKYTDDRKDGRGYLPAKTIEEMFTNWNCELFYNSSIKPRLKQLNIPDNAVEYVIAFSSILNIDSMIGAMGRIRFRTVLENERQLRQLWKRLSSSGGDVVVSSPDCSIWMPAKNLDEFWLRWNVDLEKIMLSSSNITLEHLLFNPLPPSLASALSKCFLASSLSHIQAAVQNESTVRRYYETMGHPFPEPIVDLKLETLTDFFDRHLLTDLKEVEKRFEGIECTNDLLQLKDESIIEIVQGHSLSLPLKLALHHERIFNQLRRVRGISLPTSRPTASPPAPPSVETKAITPVTPSTLKSTSDYLSNVATVPPPPVFSFPKTTTTTKPSTIVSFKPPTVSFSPVIVPSSVR